MDNENWAVAQWQSAVVYPAQNGLGPLRRITLWLWEATWFFTIKGQDNFARHTCDLPSA
jgi:hypothetical protein